MDTAIAPAPSANGDGKKKKLEPRHFQRNPTANYSPQGNGWWGYASSALDNRPVFTFMDVGRMLTDPRVLFIEKLWRAPFQKQKFDTKADTKGVANFVQNTVKRFWRKSLPRLLSRYFRYGFAAGGAEYVARRGYERLDRVKTIQYGDASPRTYADGPNEGRFAGFNLKSKNGPQTWVGSPHAFWFAGQQEFSEFYDVPPLAGMFEPWLVKNGRQGQKHLVRLWFRKHAVRGMIGRYPPGTTSMGSDESVTPRNNQDVMRELLDYAESMGVFCFENTPNPAEGMAGRYEWEIEDQKPYGDVAGFLDWGDKLNDEMLEAVGIPKEVVQSAESGSGYNGRLLPYQGFLGIVDELSGLILDACDSWLRPLVEFNFGPGTWYEVQALSLADAAEEEQRDAQKRSGELPAKPGAGGDIPFTLSTLEAKVDRLLTAPREPAPPQTDPAVLAVLTKLSEGLALLAERQNKPLELAATVAPEDDPAAKAQAFDATAKKLTRQRKSTVVQLLALAMVRAQQRATAAGKPEEAAGSLKQLSELAGDPVQVAKIVGMREMSAVEMSALELAWTGPHQGPRGGSFYLNTETNKKVYTDKQPGERRERQQKAEERAKEIVKKVAGRKATPEEVRELAEQLPHVRNEELLKYRAALEFNLRGERKKQWMVERLLDHVERSFGNEGPPRAPEESRAKKAKAEAKPEVPPEQAPESTPEVPGEKVAEVSDAAPEKEPEKTLKPTPEQPSTAEGGTQLEDTPAEVVAEVDKQVQKPEPSAKDGRGVANLTGADLPPIPEDTNRHTHFTGTPEQAQAIMRGGLDYSAHGILENTADLFGDKNEDVAKAIREHKVGNFSREKFGNYAVILDIPETERRSHYNFQDAPGKVDASRVAGFMDRATGKFIPNPNYNPKKEVAKAEPPPAPVGGARRPGSAARPGGIPLMVPDAPPVPVAEAVKEEVQKPEPEPETPKKKPKNTPSVVSEDESKKIKAAVAYNALLDAAKGGASADRIEKLHERAKAAAHEFASGDVRDKLLRHLELAAKGTGKAAPMPKQDAAVEDVEPETVGPEDVEAMDKLVRANQADDDSPGVDDEPVEEKSVLRVKAEKARDEWQKAVAGKKKPAEVARLKKRFDEYAAALPDDEKAAVTGATGNAKKAVAGILDEERELLARRRAKATPAKEPPAPKVEAKKPGNELDRPALYRDIAAEVNRFGESEGRGARFNELYAHAKARHPALTPAEFKAAVKKLDADGHIAVSGWNESTDDVPDKSLNLWHHGGDAPRGADDKLYYHANPASWHGATPKTDSPEASAPKVEPKKPAKKEPAHVAAANKALEGETDPAARDWIESALHNHDGTPEDFAKTLGASIEESGSDARGEPMTRKVPAAAVEAGRRALKAVGAEEDGEPGDGAEFDPRRFQPAPGLFKGDRVRVVRPPLVMGGSVVGRGKVVKA